MEMVGFVSGFFSGIYWLLSSIPGPAGIVANTLGAVASLAPYGFWLWQAYTAGKYKDEEVFIICVVLVAVILVCLLTGTVGSLIVQAVVSVGFAYSVYYSCK